MKFSLIILALVTSILATEPLQARLMSHLMNLEEAKANADLIVIATPSDQSKDCKPEEITGLPGWETVKAVGVETKLKVLTVMKGAVPKQDLVLHHYREYGRRISYSPPCLLKFYRNGCAYLFFLTLEKDGRYSPVSGQIDPAYTSIFYLENVDQVPQEEREHPLRNATIPLLTETLQSEDYQLGSEAARMLGYQGVKAHPAIPALAQALHSSAEDVCGESAKTLGKLGPAARSAVPELEAALGWNDYYLRVAAAAALNQIDPDNRVAVPQLIELLKFNHPDIRNRAAQALGEVGSQAKEAIPALSLLKNDESEEVRLSAEKAISEISHPKKANVSIQPETTSVILPPNKRSATAVLSYAGLQKAADLVVIATPVKTPGSTQKIDPGKPGPWYVGAEKTFEIVTLLKGPPGIGQFVLENFYEPYPGAQATQRGSESYLLFLKKKSDGHYLVVSGSIPSQSPVSGLARSRLYQERGSY